MSFVFSGSPSFEPFFPAGVWIVEVQGKPVTDLDSFLAAVKKFEKRAGSSGPILDQATNDNTPLAKTNEESLIAPGDVQAVTGEDDSTGKAQSTEQEIDNESSDDSNVEDGYVRIKTINRTGVTQVVAIKLDCHYWTTWQLLRDESCVSGWKCIKL